jgi:hypothetical protein
MIDLNDPNVVIECGKLPSLWAETLQGMAFFCACGKQLTPLGFRKESDDTLHVIVKPCGCSLLPPPPAELPCNCLIPQLEGNGIHSPSCDVFKTPPPPADADRGAAYEKVKSAFYFHFQGAWTDSYARAAFLRELDAAVAWAKRTERERAAKMIDALASRCRSDGAADGYRELAKRIRSDPDAPATTTKE